MSQDMNTAIALRVAENAGNTSGLLYGDSATVLLPLAAFALLILYLIFEPAFNCILIILYNLLTKKEEETEDEKDNY